MIVECKSGEVMVEAGECKEECVVEGRDEGYVGEVVSVGAGVGREGEMGCGEEEENKEVEEEERGRGMEE